ncbi:hypothetical protein EV363DRAFT_294169 [Boletus edulis]|uniref:Uncharacterized protein n=1 Tax=Boletus edulis BED1 TaxID=1328754 RepID=A0AAD4BI28_BOLED|nr:hypothetical protein EV363DRAFT_294169 [Boletus edulis]KAF8431190.1 hypothetical protein L210DRAFT_2997446 [Boletus edulis BED1]
MFRLWDTPWLGEGLHGSGSQKRASCTSTRDLVAFICFRGISKIMPVTKRTHGLVMKIHDKFSPAILAITIIAELEGRSTTSDTARSMEEWRATNAGVLSDYEMSFSGRACIPTLPDDYHPQIPGHRELRRELTRNLIMNQSLRPRIVPPKTCAPCCLERLASGESSLIDLLAGWQIASVSPDSAPCTLDSSEYQFQLGSTTVRFGAIEKAV